MADYTISTAIEEAKVLSEVTIRQQVGRYDRSFYFACILAIFLCWSPSKLIGYVAPWIVVGWFILTTRSETALRNVIVILVGWLVAVALAALVTPSFAVHSALLSLLTYGSIFVVASLPSKFVGGDLVMERLLSLARWVVLIQGTWGILQGAVAALQTGTFDGSTGDAVAGTIRPFAFESDLSNPMFAINMGFLLILLLPSLIRDGRGKLPYVVGVLALVLASVLHVLLFLGIAFVAAILITYPLALLKRNGVVLLLILGIASLVAVNLLSRNFASMSRFVQYTFEGRTQRALAVQRVFTTMPDAYPWMPFVGLGPGQFSSRAALIGTGMYFGTPANPTDLPLLSEGMSEPFEDFLLDLWMSLFFDVEGNYVHTLDNTSSTVQPFFSWLSLYTEFGTLGIVAVVVTLGWLVTITRIRSAAASNRLSGIAIITGLFFLFLLGIQENYWEVPQAILVGTMLLKAQYANLGRQARADISRPVAQ